MPTMRPSDVRNAMSEDDLLEYVTDLADVFGWRCYHTHDSRHSQRGFPDLVLVRARRLIFAELKSAKGELTVEQKAWIEALAYLEGDVVEVGSPPGKVEVHLWRPTDMAEIERVLR